MVAAAPPQNPTTPKNLEEVAQPTAAKQAPSRHGGFYFSDEMSVFQIEDRLFRVHRHFLAENSPIFNAMFSLPSPRGAKVGSTAEGASDANPIYLPEVTLLEFETLLRFFYKSFSLPQASWIALLSIAQRYEFPDVRERAIHEIYSPFKSRRILPSEDEQELRLLISVAEKYDVPPRNIVSLLISFVVRGQPLTEDEVSGFSALTVSKLAHAREECRAKGGYAEQIVRRIWQVPRDEIR